MLTGSSIGQKRSYNASPPETTSPGVHAGVYGGAVQDQHYSHSTQSPAAKRHRTGSEYDHSHLYQSLQLGDNSLSQYSSTVPSSTRPWTGNDHHRVQSSYSAQQSPMHIPMMSRAQQPLPVQTPPSWQPAHQQSSLPSPTPSVSNQQQPSYPAVTSQHSPPGAFGESGSTPSAIPRQYYNNSNSYHYQAAGQYQSQNSGDLQNAYSDLHIPGSTLPDTAGLASGQAPGYSQNYLGSGSIYSAEPHDVHTYVGDNPHKY